MHPEAQGKTKTKEESYSYVERRFLEIVFLTTPTRSFV
jgi:hypothetical protein